MCIVEDIDKALESLEGEAKAIELYARELTIDAQLGTRMNAVLVRYGAIQQQIAQLRLMRLANEIAEKVGQDSDISINDD